MPTKEEILNALTIIKQVCDNADECINCPLRENRNGDACYVKSSLPQDWKIGEEQPPMWRAFAD